MMDSPEKAPQTAADHINALNECDAKIVRLLRVHADAVRCLTAQGGNSRLTIDQRRAVFKAKISDFMKLLSEIRETQHQAIYALRDTASTDSEENGKGQEHTNSIIGELGSLDVSFLNSRNDAIGKNIEAEQWAKAAELVQKFAPSGGSSA